MTILYTKKIEDKKKYMDLIQRILSESIEIFEIERFYEGNKTSENDRKYNVYRIFSDLGSFILKNTSIKEAEIYEKFLNKDFFPVPHFYGKVISNHECWILIEYIEGSDLRNFTDEMARQCAVSITKIMNQTWFDVLENPNIKHKRFEEYIKRITKRAECLEHEERLKKAYEIFLIRQKTCPRTFCNGDFLQFNAIFNKEKVIIIDWAFGGMMPYSLDIARLIAHGTENRKPFPFYMNDHQKRIYVESVYDLLKIKPEYQQYLFDIKLSVLNEYVEFIEEELKNKTGQGDEMFDFYYQKAGQLAEEINKSVKIVEKTKNFSKHLDRVLIKR